MRYPNCVDEKTRIKLCGLSRVVDIEVANQLLPEYVGFVFAKKSTRYVSSEQAAELKKRLHPEIRSVGVFVNEEAETVADLLAAGVIDIVQLHGREDEAYIEKLRAMTDQPIIQAFSMDGEQAVHRVSRSLADFVLLDAGSGGTGTAFDWDLLSGVKRPYFLAGGLDPLTVGDAVKRWRPYAVDVSSGIETDGVKDAAKMRAFVCAVREA